MPKETDILDFFDLPEEELKSFYDYNKTDPYTIYVDEHENAIDSLETSLSVLERQDNMKWKWFVFALHHSLYSFCVCALKNGNYENVLMRSWDADDKVYFQDGDSNLIKKSVINEFFIKDYKTSAYRIHWDVVESIPEKKLRRGKEIKKEKLISFWTALARIQDDIWMKRLVGSNSAIITDEQLEKICWLSERIRNDLMHFIPKGYSIGILSIIDAGTIILDIIKFLVRKSNSIFFLNFEESMSRINKALNNLEVVLTDEMNKITASENDQENYA